MALISPHFIECMASGELVFCRESEFYNKIFTDDTYQGFKSYLCDFDGNLYHFLTTEANRKKIIEKAHAVAKTEHAWVKRSYHFLTALKNQFSGRTVA